MDETQNDKLKNAMGMVKTMVQKLSDVWFLDIQRAEVNYNIRDIMDHLASVKSFGEEAIKIYNGLNDKIDARNKKR